MAWPITLGYYADELQALVNANQKQREMSNNSAILGAWGIRPATLKVNSWSPEKVIYHWVWEPIDRATYPPFSYTKAMYLEEIPVTKTESPGAHARESVGYV